MRLSWPKKSNVFLDDCNIILLALSILVSASKLSFDISSFLRKAL